MAGRDVDRLQEEIAELFADLWRVPRFVGQRGGFRPNVDSYHTDDPHELVVLVELADVDPASVRVVVGERVLVVSGERIRPRAEGRVYQQAEIEYGPFQRHVRLAEDVDRSRARAEYERGILTISLPVADESQAPLTRGRITIAVER
jgi:HSP20 family protein